MVVTADKYELPVLTFETRKEAAITLHLKQPSITNAIRRGSRLMSGAYKGCRIVSVRL